MLTFETKKKAVKKNIIQVLKILIPVSLGVFLVVKIYNSLSIEQKDALFDAFREANYFWVVLSFFMGVLSHWIRGYRWKFQLEAMGYTPSTTNNFLAVMIGYVTNLVLPRVGEVSRAAAVSKYEKVPFQKSFGSILSERALDMIILLIITITTILLQFTLLEDFANDLGGKAMDKLNSPVLWILGGLALLCIPLFFYIIRRYRHLGFIAKIANLVDGLLEGLRSIFKMKKRGAYLLATVGIWLLYVGMFWVNFLALEQTADLSVNAVFAGFVLGSFAIVLIPGGIGAFPVGIMQALILYGIAEEIGFALGNLIWFSQTAMIVLVGGFSLLYMPIYNKRRVHVAT